MALNTPGKRTVNPKSDLLTNTNDSKLLLFYYFQLKHLLGIVTPSSSIDKENSELNIKTDSDYLKKLIYDKLKSLINNDTFLNKYSQKIDENIIANKIIEAKDKFLIDNNDIEFIKSNKYACFFLIMLLTNNFKSSTNFINNIKSINYGHNEIFYDSQVANNIFFYTDSNLYSHNERLELILNFIYKQPIILNHYNFKVDFVDVKNYFTNYPSTYKKYKWLSINDSESLVWANNYINEKVNEYYLDINPNRLPVNDPELISINYLNNILKRFDNLNPDSRYYLIHFAILFLHTQSKNKYMLREFNNLFVKAWNQYKARRDREDKKAINTYVSIDTKNKLDKIAIKYGRRMGEMLEIIINERYEYEQEKSKNIQKNI